MKNLTIILLILAPLGAFGQQKNYRANQGWAIDLLYSPDTYVPPQREGAASFNQERAYRIGFNVIRDLKNNEPLSFRTGLRYVVLDVRFESNQFFLNPPRTIVSFEKIKYYEVPLALRYTFGKRSLRGYAEAMTSINVGNKSSRLKPHATWGLSLGLEYPIIDNLYIFGQPILRKQFVNNNIYAIAGGIEMGIKWRY